MSINKNDRVIDSLEKWRRYAGPKRPNQWKDERSAKEVARAWLGAGNKMPEEVVSILSGHPNFGPVLTWVAEPEAKLKFDDFSGETRNSDIAVYVRDTFGLYLLAVEAKADEPFGESVAQTFSKAFERRKKDPNSNGAIRAEQLVLALLGLQMKDSARFGNLRYQLLTACAGALCEAERKGCSRSIMLVHEFITNATTDKKHAKNETDLENFMEQLSNGTVNKVSRGQLYGPFFVHGEPLLKSKVALYIGKVSRNLRTNGA